MIARGKPVIGIPASILEVTARGFRVHASGARNVEAVDRVAGCLPVILPALHERADVDTLATSLDGLLLTGGRANVEPHHFGGEPFPDDEPIDPARDNLVLPLVRACIASAVPVFGICRGIQEMNVALGGSLHYRVHLLPGKDDHRMPRHDDVTEEEIFRLRHPVTLSPNGLFAALAGAGEVMVNSLHGQAIDDLADNLVVEAVSHDGVIEGVRLAEDRSFTVGVQWHAEHDPEKHRLSEALWHAFGDAARERNRGRTNLSS